jgi:hypothetical protein
VLYIHKYICVYVYVYIELDQVAVRIPVRANILLYSETSRPALGPTKPPIKREMKFFPGRPGREVNRSPPTGVEVKNEWGLLLLLLYDFMACKGITLRYIHALYIYMSIYQGCGVGVGKNVPTPTPV